MYNFHKENRTIGLHHRCCNYSHVVRILFNLYLMSPVGLFFNWDSLHARLNSHNEAWSYKKRTTKKITRYRKSV